MLLLLYLVFTVTACIAKPPSPHLVFIVIDDLGWNDVGYHNPDIISPTIDNLALSGIILNQSYVQPVCSPSRSAFFTGVYPLRLGTQHLVIINNQPVCVPLSRNFLPQVLKANGYVTHMVGKWHLGFCQWECTPTYRGFDSFYGYYNGGENYFSKMTGQGLDFRFNTTVDTEAVGDYSTYQYASRADDIIKSHDPDQPLFLYLPFQNVHEPLQVPEKYVKLYPNIKDENRRNFSAMVTALDDAIARVVTSLKTYNLYDDTLIVFTSDNGGWTTYGGNNYPLRGGKLSIFEGGTRVPAFLHGKMLQSQGQVYNGMMHAVDWFSTVVKALNITYSDPDQDSLSQWESINSLGPSQRTEFIYNLDYMFPPLQGKSAIRSPQLYPTKVHNCTPQKKSTTVPHKSPQLYPTKEVHNCTPQKSTTVPHKRSPQLYPTKVHNSTPQKKSTTVHHKGPQLYPTKVHNCTPQKSTTVPHKSSPQLYPTKEVHNCTPQKKSTTVPHKIPQLYPTKEVHNCTPQKKSTTVPHKSPQLYPTKVHNCTPQKKSTTVPHKRSPQLYPTKEVHNCTPQKKSTTVPHKEVHNCTPQKKSTPVPHKEVHNCTPQKKSTPVPHKEVHNCTPQKKSTTVPHKRSPQLYPTKVHNCPPQLSTTVHHKCPHLSNINAHNFPQYSNTNVHNCPSQMSTTIVHLNTPPQLFTTSVHHSCPPLLSTTSVHHNFPPQLSTTSVHFCPPQLSTTSVHHFCLPLLSTTNVHHNCPPQLPTITVHHICPPQLSTTAVHHICPLLSTSTVHLNCPPHLSTSVHLNCPPQLSTTSVHFCPPQLSTTTVHHSCPPHLSTSVHLNCPPQLSTSTVHHICPLLSTSTVHLNCPPLLSTSVHLNCPPQLVGDFKLIEGFPGLYQDWYKPAQLDQGINITTDDLNFDSPLPESINQMLSQGIFQYLFNLKDDPTEHNNLYDQLPDVVKQLQDRLNEYKKKYVPPNFPLPTPKADPKNFGGAWTPGWC
ncbi:hypothetical protein Btru_074419 [Bulinus truncatus]|nr:hypothetical protein Btru_074419 [Bulinus truncatus]